MSSSPQRTYDRREKDLALTAYALAQGSGKTAEVTAAILAENDGLEIPFATIQNWAYNSKERERYLQIREEVAEFTRAQQADDATRYASLAATVVEKGLRWLEELIDNRELDPKHVPKAVKEAATAHGIGIDKAEKLNDRPSVRVSVEFPDLMRDLKDMGLEVEVIDGDAEEATEEDDGPAEDREPIALLPAGS